MSDKQGCVHRSKTYCQTLKHFDNVFATVGNNIVEVFVKSGGDLRRFWLSCLGPLGLLLQNTFKFVGFQLF
jgi:hypothetical protein